MIQIERNTYRRFKDGEISVEEFADYLLKNHNAYEIALAFAEAAWIEVNVKPITITQAEFDAHFRIRGTKMVNGDIVEENRGRKPKELKDLKVETLL